MTQQGQSFNQVSPSTSPAKDAATRARTPATPILSQAQAVGQGFNVFGPLSLSSMIQPLFDYAGAPTTTFTFLGVDYLIPVFVTGVENTSSYTSGGAFETREAFQNSIAAHAGVEMSYGCFSGELQMDYASQYAQSSRYGYVYQDAYTQLAYLDLNVDPQYFTTEFQAAIAALPPTCDETNFLAFFSFFETWGAYYTQRIVLGGECSLYAAVADSAALSSSQLSTMFSAQYNGLFASGSISASITGSQAWQTYTQNSTFSVVAKGGTPTAVGALTAVQPLNPSNGTVGAFQNWLASVSTDPAVVDFQLAGIWNLCGAKAPAVQTAWEMYGNVMHPHLVIQTTGNSIQWPVPAPTPPLVMLGTEITPAAPPASPAGYQLIIADGKNLVDQNGEPSGILLNKYYAVPAPQSSNGNWMLPDPAFPGFSLWQNPYNQMLADIQTKGLANNDNIIILVGFNMDFNMPPTAAMKLLLDSAGGGPALDTWCQDTDAGSEEALGLGYWVCLPTPYVLVGIFGQGQASGVEAIATAPFEGSTALGIDVFFYRQIYGGAYTLAQG